MEEDYDYRKSKEINRDSYESKGYRDDLRHRDDYDGKDYDAGERGRAADKDWNNRDRNSYDLDERESRYSNTGEEESRDRRRRRRRREHGRTDDRERRDDRPPRHQSEKPCRVIVLRQLPITVDEDEIRAALQIFGAPVKDVRLVKHKDTGVSRGFAFVEFQFLPDAQLWMDSNQGLLSLGGCRVPMNYSTSRDREDDWFCSQCGTHNFKRRDFCFKCSIPKDESERFSEISPVPTRTLILMGLDTLTTEERVRKELNEITSIEMNIQVARDPMTSVSRGSCYVAVATVDYSSQLLEILNNMNPAFTLDGKQVSVHYCRDHTDPIYSGQQDAWQGSNQSYGSDYNQYYQQHHQHSSQYGYAQHNTAYNQYQQQAHSKSTRDKMALAQEQVQQARKMLKHQGGGSPESKSNDSWSKDYESSDLSSSQDGKRSRKESESMSRPSVPDTSHYQYDESSGFYYDPQTGLYYDPNSQYYYNADSQQYLYWDSEQQTYVPAPESSSQSNQFNASSQETEDKPKEKKEEKKKEEKNKVAKKVAKDMARWAKSINEMKSTSKKSMPSSSMKDNSSAAADAGFAMLSKRADPEETKNTVWQAMKKQSDPVPNIVASYGGESDSDTEAEAAPETKATPERMQLTDWTKLICLLCKRQFPSKEVLVKHQQFSDLHKQNLEALNKKMGIASDADTSDDFKYRDRAKERREKFGSVEPPPKRKYRPPQPAPVPAEEPTKFGIGSDNIGSKMLQNMGWKEGTGLGKRKQGRTDIIQVEQRQEGAGLGARGSRYKVSSSDSYREAVKQVAQQRFREIQMEGR